MSKHDRRPQRQKPRGGKPWRSHGESFNEYKAERRRRSEMERGMPDSNMLDADYWNERLPNAEPGPT